jgi:hypothetical protein
LPAAAEPELMVSVAEFPAVIELGLKEAVAPAGRPLNDSDTDSALPEATAVETVVDPVFPCVMERLAGEAEIVKSLVLVLITSETLVVCVALTLLPVIVRE